MNKHFCKVGTIRPNLEKVSSLNDLEKKHSNFIEEAYNLTQTDSGLSDVLYHEASKLKRRITRLKGISSSALDAAF
ncbi:Lacal_2735 family protein [Mangrovimonas sp. TPBH4]|uniref:Lacal_2735 family protein n=1 Tax=Mangrovimonas sp. TPBH4 TaxID=1645914 RepID=UPI0006B58CFA|nr:Lacal_2735 family protein [Mangrovimonas sp. TPBH4]